MLYANAGTATAAVCNPAMNAMNMYSIMQMQESSKAAALKGGTPTPGLATPPPAGAAPNSATGGYATFAVGGYMAPMATPPTRGGYAFPPFFAAAKQPGMVVPSSANAPVAAPAALTSTVPHQQAAPASPAPTKKNDDNNGGRRAGKHGNRRRHGDKAEDVSTAPPPSTELTAAPDKPSHRERRRRGGDGPPPERIDDTRAPSPACPLQPDDGTDAYHSPHTPPIPLSTLSGGSASPSAAAVVESSARDNGHRKHRHRHSDREGHRQPQPQQQQQQQPPNATQPDQKKLRQDADLKASHRRRHHRHRGREEDGQRRHHRHHHEGHSGGTGAPHTPSPAVAASPLLTSPSPTTQPPEARSVVASLATCNHTERKVVPTTPLPPPIVAPKPPPAPAAPAIAPVSSSRGHHRHRTRNEPRRPRTPSSHSASSRTSSSTSSSYSYSDSGDSRSSSSHSSRNRHHHRRSGRGRRRGRRRASSLSARSSSSASSSTPRHGSKAAPGTNATAAPDEGVNAGQSKKGGGLLRFFRRSKSSTTPIAEVAGRAQEGQGKVASPLIMPTKSLFDTSNSALQAPLTKDGGVADKQPRNSSAHSTPHPHNREHPATHPPMWKGHPHQLQPADLVTGQRHNVQAASAAGVNSNGIVGEQDNKAKTFFGSLFHKKKDKLEVTTAAQNAAVSSDTSGWMSPKTRSSTPGSTASHTLMQPGFRSGNSEASSPRSRDGIPLAGNSGDGVSPLPPKSGFFSKFMKKKLSKTMATQQSQQQAEREAMRKQDSKLEEERRALDVTRSQHKEQRRQRHSGDSFGSPRSRSSSTSRHGHRGRRGKHADSKGQVRNDNCHHSSPRQPGNRDGHKGRQPSRRREGAAGYRRHSRSSRSSSYYSYSSSSTTPSCSETPLRRSGREKKRNDKELNEI
ncbi:hypothetical protein ABL78_4733 [Leptomonas seymouri]|uniref:Uncharacterized protein n=1 Tax=Leptomonas seymouri TaxID=5684 RepID=A0A0N1PC04_LEPSE|nr:hypothetical protein ABL78_4733 [Leptomonas seymouri]|eukprot:KPI86220.1 hypothetical protein ABL78_4733 [Leptomonas seymouri]